MERVSPLVLGIETSCDDTAAAVVDGEGRVLASVVSSQPAAHRPFGGVVPEIASRDHLTHWPRVAGEALAQAGLGLEAIDVVAATRGPGLIGSLLVGLSVGRAIAWALGRPFLAVHHLEGHLYSPFLGADGDSAAAAPDRFIGLVLSGGHSNLYRVVGPALETVAETRDDALGEIFDKIGKRLGLAYPQGPRVDELAERGDASRAPLPVARCSDGALDFSYSGLKSRTVLGIEALERRGVGTDLGAGEPAAEVLDLLAGFRKAAVDQVLDRLRLLHAATPLGVLAVSGGAAANRLLRRSLAAWSEAEDVDLRLVALSLSGDNAAMIAHAALLRHRRGEHDDPLAVEAASRLPIDSGHGLRPEVDVDDSAAPLPATEEADDGKVEPTA